MKEIWKPIEDYEGLYEVSNLGKVRNTNYRNTGIPKELTLQINNKGYFVIILHKNGKCHKNLVHRLVGKAFIQNPENKPQINHIDGDKRNNYFKNLEWCTNSENTIHAYKNGLYHNKKLNRKYA